MPDQALKVLVVEARPERAQTLTRLLTELGMGLAGVAADGLQACLMCVRQAPDLALVASDLPGGDGIDSARAIMRCKPLPVILLVEREDRVMLERAQRAGVRSCLVAPVAAAVLGPALEMAHRNFGRESRLAEEVAQLREGLRQRKLLERAKGLLMARFQVDEAGALARLEETARTLGSSLHQAAEAVVESERMLAGPQRRRRSRAG